jgi:23S rRNA (cytidine1920-2'-O)/16S rRNA (cytidine1409-2'-O)-methyltransferase
MDLEGETMPRLDELLVQRGFFKSRSRARDAVERGTVKIAGAIVKRPSLVVSDAAEVVVDDPAAKYVSRAALKLVGGLAHFGFDPAGNTALDVGASTGGFTQVLLERGATKVYAIDVGHGQIDASLRADPRVIVRERLNARVLTLPDLDNEAPDFIVCDVSFVSLKLALPAALGLAKAGAKAMLLVKPQFEAGRDSIGKGGILKDPAEGPRIADAISAWLETNPGWRSLGWKPSPIEGGDGNREFLLGGIRDR